MSKLLCQSRWCRAEARGGPRQVEPTRPMCRECARRVPEDLGVIAKLWPDLQERLSIEPGISEQVTSTPTPGIVINEPVSEAMREVIEWTWFLVRIVIDEANNSRLPRDQDVPTLLAWIARWHSRRFTHHADHGLAVSVAEDAANLRDLTFRRAHPSLVKRVQLPGRCVGLDDDGELCRGGLFALVRIDASLLPSEILCEKSEDHRIPPNQWASYGRKVMELDPQAALRFRGVLFDNRLPT